MNTVLTNALIMTNIYIYDIKHISHGSHLGIEHLMVRSSILLYIIIPRLILYVFGHDY